MLDHTFTYKSENVKSVVPTFSHQHYGTLPLQCHCLDHDPSKTRRLIIGRYYLARIRTILHDRGQS